MRPHVPEPQRTLDDGGEPARDGPADLTGSLSRLGVFEMLQLVAQLGSGALRLDDGAGVVTRLSLEEGDLLGATRRHLQDREAVLDLLTTRQSDFQFWKRVGGGRGRPGARGSLQDILLESARLADELELRASYVPPEDSPLRHRTEHPPVEDPLECRTPDVFAAVRSRTGVTRRELEESLPYASVRVRLGLAALVQSGHLRERRAESIVQPFSLTGMPPWYVRLLGSGNGLRVLLGVPEGVDVASMIRRLAKDLATDPPEGTGLSEGPLFARIRPRAGGLLSITAVTLNRRNRFLFPTLSRGVELVIAADPSVDPKELDPRARVLSLSREQLGESTLVDAVRWVADQHHGT